MWSGKTENNYRTMQCSTVSHVGVCKICNRQPFLTQLVHSNFVTLRGCFLIVDQMSRFALHDPSRCKQHLLRFRYSIFTIWGLSPSRYSHPLVPTFACLHIVSEMESVMYQSIRVAFYLNWPLISVGKCLLELRRPCSVGWKALHI